MKRILLACLVLMLCASAAQAGVTYDTVRATENLYVGSVYGTDKLALDNSESTMTLTLAPGSTTRYPINFTVAPTRATGASGLYLNVTQTTSGLSSGSMQALDVTANAGSNANTGAIRGAQIKARQPDAGCTDLVAIYASVDQKDQTCTNQRGLEVSIDGDAGGAATTTQGVVVYNNSSGNQGTDIAYDINGGTASGHDKFTYDIRFQQGATVDEGTDGKLAWGSCYLDVSRTLTSQTTEGNSLTLDLTTDSTFLTGTNITYSSARGSAPLKITGTYSGVDGGYTGVLVQTTNTGEHTADGAGIIGTKCIVTNTAALADGNIYGGQFWAKHNHATNVMTAQASLIGLEGIAYNAGNGPARTVIGVNAGYHNEGDVAKGDGSVFRGIQVICDDASGATQADETTGICLWNMAGTQTGAIRIVESDGGFGSLLDFSAAGTCIVADTDAVPANSTHKILIRVGDTTYYIPVHSTW